MKTSIFKKYICRILPAVFVLFSVWSAYSGQNGVRHTIDNANEPFDDDTIVDAALLIPVNTVSVEDKYQGGPFRAETRKDKMERYKCSQCHNNKKEVFIEKAKEMAHGDIKLVHGGKENQLTCFTCHKKNERDFLKTEKASRVDMDHSYQLCGQCHFRQKRDWIGGAHGKRVSLWAGDRIVKNCTSCHDPHAPLFKKQWPRTYSRPYTK